MLEKVLKTHTQNIAFATFQEKFKGSPDKRQTADSNFAKIAPVFGIIFSLHKEAPCFYKYFNI